MRSPSQAGPEVAGAATGGFAGPSPSRRPPTTCLLPRLIGEAKFEVLDGGHRLASRLAKRNCGPFAARGDRRIDASADIGGHASSDGSPKAGMRVSMIGEIAEVEDGQTLRFGLCIIGAGAAGIAIAREFIGTKVDVILLESGGFELEEKVQDLYAGESIGIDYEHLDAVRLRYFGGTTNHWGGQSFNLDSLDFEERTWVPDSGWPIAYSEFVRYLPRAQQLCRLGDAPFSWEYWSVRPDVPQFPLDQARFETAVHRFPNPIPRFGEIYREDINRAQNVRCLLHANVLRLSTDASRRTVTHAEVASFQDRRIRIAADKFILATGGIENCRLLLVSGEQGDSGLGNQHDVVGRYFMEHASYDSGEITLVDPASVPFLSSPYFESAGYSLRAEFKLRREAQAEEQALNHSAFLLPAQRSEEHDRGPIGQLVHLWNRLENRFVRFLYPPDTFTLRVRVEQAPNPESRVLLAAETDRFGLPRANLMLKFGDLEARTIEILQEQFARELGRAGLGRMRITFEPADDQWQNNVGWGYHHCGGTRMHADPKFGVVNANGRVHGLSNLYVAGSSIFPTAGYTNPTLNLIALALRLAGHVREELDT